jgi:AbrB family looped-hinge helix DNA binding protein
MAKVRVNYDGWLALPATVRQRLDLSTGDELELELVDGGVVLRPLRSTAAGEASPESVTAEPAAPEPPPAAASVVERDPGRPRKSPLPPTLKARGGRRKTAAETAR